MNDINGYKWIKCPTGFPLCTSFLPSAPAEMCGQHVVRGVREKGGYLRKSSSTKVNMWFMGHLIPEGVPT